MSAIRIIANAFVRIMFEPTCVACRHILPTPLARAVCDACWSRIEPVRDPQCLICGDELTIAGRQADAAPGEAGRCERCARSAPAFSVARSAGRFDGPLREVIHAFKFEGRRLLAEPLGRLLLSAGREVLVDTDAVVPVPLHPLRSLARGFNQADDLARQLKLPVWRVLRRPRHGPPQAGLPAGARRLSPRGHFAPGLRTRMRRPLGRPLAGARLVLIDDVMTTGATLDECARILRGAGAAEVRALTVARAVAGRPPRPAAPPRPSATRR